METYERIAKAIRESGKSKSRIAAECGVSPAAVTQWLTGESKSLKADNAYNLAIATGFSPRWISLGEGPERLEDGYPDKGPRRRAFQAVDVLAKVVPDSDGSWTAVEDLDGRVTVGSSDPEAYAFRVMGDGLSPSIRSGWFVVCEPGNQAEPGDYVVIRLKGTEAMPNGQLILRELLFMNSEQASVMSLSGPFGRRSIPVDDIDHMHLVAYIVSSSKFTP